MTKEQNLGVYNIPMGMRNMFFQRNSMYLIHHMPPKPEKLPSLQNERPLLEDARPSCHHE